MLLYCTYYRPGVVYRRRWYMLGLFSFVAILQDTVWNTWGPVEHTAKFLYGWSDELIALFANYGSILYIVAFIPVVYLLEKSLRLSMLMTTGFMALGTILRCISLQTFQVGYIPVGLFTVSCHICSILNGIANIVVGSAPLVLSSAWFPAEERITATSVAQVFNGLGTGMSFLLASQIVTPIDVYRNKTHGIPPAIVDEMKLDIQLYMYAQAIPAGLFFILAVIYFPSTPQHPPSVRKTFI
ncbi:disrupted in renal carcinoma protein 2 homolog [Eurytemora carolleeae]|uniref:disrupted in renal carcinoma protein 2 homolog n=1 Tax=Eurytemora carolleeae TaxID=1294199 RepID=UPI000C77812D|nr:disrupted in renal carcinoma protein 2 homolog [Eurytemora carolleeae]|eukprot:XP_023343454.1 disrupted in renal carcinoma protein 2 homolog [Eurytemora affinis]